MSNLTVSTMSYPELQAKAKELGLKSVGIRKTALQAEIQAVLDSQTTELDQPIEDQANQSSNPVATGKLGGNGEFYYFPDSKVYAPMVNGKADQPSFDQVTWDLVSPALPSVNVAKATVIKAMEKAAEIKLNKYRISLTINFDPQWIESAESLDGVYSLDEAAGLLDRLGHGTESNLLNLAKHTLQVTIDKKGSKSSGSGKHIGGTTDRFDRPSITEPVPSYKIRPVARGSSAHTCLMALMEGAGKDQDRVNEISIINGTEPYDTKKQNWKIRQCIAQYGYGLKDGFLVMPEGMTEIRTK